MDPYDKYYINIIKIINKENRRYMKDFYTESPNWLENLEVKYINKTLKWINKSNTDKKRILDNELDEYFS